MQKKNPQYFVCLWFPRNSSQQQHFSNTNCRAASLRHVTPLTRLECRGRASRLVEDNRWRTLERVLKDPDEPSSLFSAWTDATHRRHLLIQGVFDVVTMRHAGRVAPLESFFK